MSEIEILVSSSLLLLGPGGEHSVDDVVMKIAEETNSEPPRSTVSATLQRMKETGLVKRVVVQDDNRARIRYSLSAKGLRRLSKVGDLVVKALSEVSVGS